MPMNILNVQINGKGSPLVLIHGVAGSLHIWDPIVEQLSQHYQVIRLDLLGYGHSPKPHITYTPLAHLAAIRNTLKSLSIPPPYTLIGLSMGVNLSLEYAARWPHEVSNFIGIGFPYYADEAAARKNLQNNIWTRLAVQTPLLGKLVAPPIWWMARHGIIPSTLFSKIYSPLMARDTMLNPYYVFQSSVWNCMVRNPQDKLLKATAELPKLFIQGSDDKWASPSEVAHSIADYSKSELKIIANAPHNTVVVDPDQTTRLILRHLKNIHT